MKSMAISVMGLQEELNALKAENARLQQLSATRDDDRFKIIFERSALGNKIIDADLRIIKVNKALVKLLGYKNNELIGRRITEFAHPDHVESWAILQKQLWTHKKPSFSIETCILKKDCTAVRFRVTSILFSDHDVTFGYTVLENITHRIEFDRLKEVEQKLRFDIEKNEIDKVNRRESIARVLEAQENERKRIAETLHNSIGQTLFGLKLSMERVKPKANSPEENFIILKQSMELLNDTINETRRISHELTPSILTDYGLSTALKEICKQFKGTLPLNCSIKCSTKDLDKYLATTILRTAQELVLNIAKHASATSATLSLIRKDENIELTVEDNGCGFSSASGSDGIGLGTIRSKVHLLHGTMEVHSKEYQCTSIVISLPVTISANTIEQIRRK